MTQAPEEELRHVVMSQELYYNDHMTYAKNPNELWEFKSAPGVQLTILNATSSGYAVVGSHDEVPGLRCAYFTGSPQVVPPATMLGQISCTTPPK